MKDETEDNVIKKRVKQVELPENIKKNIINFFELFSALIPATEKGCEIREDLVLIEEKLLFEKIDMKIIYSVSDYIRHIIRFLRNDKKQDFKKLLIVFNEYINKEAITEINVAKGEINEINLLKKINDVADLWNNITQNIIKIIQENQDGCGNPN